MVLRQAVFGSFVCCKLSIVKGLVGASGFEPPSSWSRTKNSKILSRFGGVAYGLKPLFFEPLIEPNLNLSTPYEGSVDSWATDSLAKSRSFELVGDELSIPGQQRIRLRDRRQFFQGFPSEPLGDLSQRSLFGIA